MRIHDIFSNEVDPLKMYVHSAGFPDSKGHDKNKEEKKDQNESDPRILDIWLGSVRIQQTLFHDGFSFTAFNQAPSNLPKFKDFLSAASPEKERSYLNFNLV